VLLYQRYQRARVRSLIALKTYLRTSGPASFVQACRARNFRRRPQLLPPPLIVRRYDASSKRYPNSC
jgi:hypothetical protein